jgi:cholinesterase
MITTLLSTISLTTLAAARPKAPAAFSVGQGVTTTSGTVEGHASSWQPEVSEYLGIPYAQPPLGPLRFAAPKAFNGTAPITAAKFSPDCPANVAAAEGSKITYSSVAATIAGILGQAGDEFSEDCLTINVWTKPQTGEKAKAVMIWIYGGGFNTGNSQSPAYNGARLANDEDVVVVSMKYDYSTLKLSCPIR